MVIVYTSLKHKFHLARHDSTWHVRRVECVETSVSCHALRQARHSQNAWALHVERIVSVETWRDKPSEIRAYNSPLGGILNHECYYPSMRTENNGLLAIFSVRQGRWLYLFSEMAYIESGGALNSTHSLTHLIDWGLASPAHLHSNPQTVDRNSWKKLQIAIDVLT